MDTQSIVTYKSAFDAIMHEIMADDGSQMEVWYARELQQVCGYARWENFQVAINRAKDSCNSQNINTDDHFRDITKMVSLGSGSEREIKDVLLTRYACYLIAQNGDPKKEEIVFLLQSNINLFNPYEQDTIIGIKNFIADHHQKINQLLH